MINIFKFTKLRRRLFITLSILFVGIPLVFIILVTMEIPRGIWEDVTNFIWTLWWIPAFYLTDVLLGLKSFGSLSNVRYTDILLALLISTIFYFILAFLLSWIGNLKKDSKLNEKE